MNFIEMSKEAYIKVMGLEKWNSLTPREQHDVVMALVKGFTRGWDAVHGTN